MNKLIAIPALLTLMATATSVHSYTQDPKTKNFNDGHISEILKTRNDGEIAISKYVLANAESPLVKEYAKHMIEDHSTNNLKKKSIIIKEAINLEPSWKSTQLQKEIKESHAKLLTLKGKELDVAYMDDQIKVHEGMVEGIKANLIPIAKRPALKKHLEMTVEVDELHLNQARAIRWNL